MATEPRALLARLAQARSIPFDEGCLPQSHFFTSDDGLALHYLDWGGEGDPVLFLHGGALTAHTWDLVCLCLRKRFRCIALDLRGHGLSGWADSYSIDSSVTDIHPLATHLDLDAPAIVGMSLGGNVAAHYAASPNARAAALVMVDVGPWVDFGATAGMREFMSRPIAYMTVDELTDEALRVSVSKDRDKILYRYMHMTRVLEAGTLAWRNDRRNPVNFPHLLAKLEELVECAPHITCPALVVRGGNSRVLTDDKVARFAGLFPRGQWVLIPGAGHNVQEDAPKELAGAIHGFLDESWGQPPTPASRPSEK